MVVKLHRQGSEWETQGVGCVWFSLCSEARRCLPFQIVQMDRDTPNLPTSLVGLGKFVQATPGQPPRFTSMGTDREVPRVPFFCLEDVEDGTGRKGADVVVVSSEGPGPVPEHTDHLFKMIDHLIKMQRRHRCCRDYTKLGVYLQ